MSYASFDCFIQGIQNESGPHSFILCKYKLEVHLFKYVKFSHFRLLYVFTPLHRFDIQSN